MKPIAVSMLLLGLAALTPAPAARADIVVPAPIIRPAPTVRLTAVRLVTSDAPEADAARVRSQARASLGRAVSGIQRCMAGLDLRRDPLRSGARVLTGRLVFARNTRPTVRIDRVRGFPRSARSCVEEALRGMAVRTTPRGTVELRFGYTIR